MPMCRFSTALLLFVHRLRCSAFSLPMQPPSKYLPRREFTVSDSLRFLVLPYCGIVGRNKSPKPPGFGLHLRVRFLRSQGALICVCGLNFLRYPVSCFVLSTSYRLVVCFWYFVYCNEPWKKQRSTSFWVRCRVLLIC